MAAPEPAREDIFHPGGKICRECVSESALKVLDEALKLARETRWDTVRSPHIFMGLLSVPDPAIRMWGERISDDLQHLLDQFQELFHQEEGQSDAMLRLNREFLSNNVIRLLRDAYGRALDHQRRVVTPMDLLISMLTATDSIVAECFERIGVTAAKLTELAVLAEQQSGAK
ncbi:MAG: hypothetical protein HYX68_02295 [Planctomycetes bacterium]|jgi:ATP-dependent Clp protease ATP-binding subunit ClpA|nr:hypothetical protein [Planctomycetota bacterium]